MAGRDGDGVLAGGDTACRAFIDRGDPIHLPDSADVHRFPSPLA